MSWSILPWFAVRFWVCIQSFLESTYWFLPSHLMTQYGNSVWRFTNQWSNKSFSCSMKNTSRLWWKNEESVCVPQLWILGVPFLHLRQWLICCCVMIFMIFFKLSDDILGVSSINFLHLADSWNPLFQVLLGWILHIMMTRTIMSLMVHWVHLSFSVKRSTSVDSTLGVAQVLLSCGFDSWYCLSPLLLECTILHDLCIPLSLKMIFSAHIWTKKGSSEKFGLFNTVGLY